MTQKITPERLRSLLDYDPETGIMTWKVYRCGQRRAGSIAGHLDLGHGRVVIGVLGKLYLRSILAWVWMKGEYPAGQIDHWDRDKTNDAWVNLRESTGSQNCFNRVYDHTVQRGVRQRRHKWHARIRKNQKEIFLGSFPTKEQAIEAYENAAIRMYSEFVPDTHLSFPDAAARDT